MAYSGPTNKATSDLVTAAHWNQDVVANVVALADGASIVTMDGGTFVLATGIAARFLIPKPLELQQVTLLADQTGSIVVDVWAEDEALSPPTVADTIAGTEKPTLATAQKNEDLALTTWINIAAGDWVGFNVDSIATVQRVTVAIRGKKT